MEIGGVAHGCRDRLLRPEVPNGGATGRAPEAAAHGERRLRPGAQGGSRGREAAGHRPFVVGTAFPLRQDRCPARPGAPRQSLWQPGSADGR